jgi:hypothetical protein
MSQVLRGFESSSSAFFDTILNTTAGTEEVNVELVRCLVQWQRERNPDLSLDEVSLAGIRASDLEIPRFLGDPRSDLVPRIVDADIQVGYMEGVQYALGFLSPSKRN